MRPPVPSHRGKMIPRPMSDVELEVHDVRLRHEIWGMGYAVAGERLAEEYEHAIHIEYPIKPGRMLRLLWWLGWWDGSYAPGWKESR